MKSGSKMGRRDNATSLFRMVYSAKEGSRVVTSLPFSQIKSAKTATWSHSVNSEDFLVAEASAFQIQAPTSPASLLRSD